MKPALRLLPWLGLAALTGCSWEEDPATCLPETTSLQVTVSARQEGDLNSRADENAKEGEFMHDLCVLFVQNNTVKLQLQPDLSNDASATAGNLENWTSGEQFLEAGTYTVYAFANTNKDYDYQNWKEDAVMPNAPEEIVLTDPAGDLNSGTRKYIPMAAKETVEITAATRIVSIGLDRLVAKVRMTIGTTSQENVTVTNVTFSGYADKVSLIKDADMTPPDRDLSYSYETENLTINNSKSKNIPDFYVNETRTGAPFTISVTTTENQGVTYLATTKLDNLPRNSIYPLTLKLNDSELSITASVYLPPIGMALEDCEVEPVDGQKDTYRLRIPAGGYFHMQLENTADITYDENACSWQNDPANSNWISILKEYQQGLPPDEGTVEGTSVWGHSSSDETYDEYPIYLTAKWTAGENIFTRKYTILISTETWDNFPLPNTNSLSEYRSLYLNKEYINIPINQ